MFSLAAGALSCPARAEKIPPLLSASARNTTDLWSVASGGVKKGTTVLNKLQLSVTLATDRLGVRGLSIHGQIFRTDGHSLSDYVGDIQTVDNIETRPVTRLFEAWVEQRLGGPDRSFAARAGLIDLNADFDSIKTASLFVNSSHGVGPDLSKSGLNGPSIYPVSALGLRLTWMPAKAWTFRVAAFDGVPGDPARPEAFASARLAPSDGALMIGQAEYHLSENSGLELGAWRYGEPTNTLDPSTPKHMDQGAYLSVETALPGTKTWSGWVRGGIANGDAQLVASYIGSGLAGEGILPGRPHDRLGIAIARAGIGTPARHASHLSNAETTLELTYQYKVEESVAIQPDIQYVVHPSAHPLVRNSLVLGLRLVVTAGYPRKAPAADSADPTVPPDGPPPESSRS